MSQLARLKTDPSVFLRQFTDGYVRSAASLGSSVSGGGWRNQDGGHSGGGCGLYADFSVFKDQTVFRRNTQPVCGKQVRIWSRLAVLVVLSSDDSVEFVEQIKVVNEPTTEPRLLPETTAKGMRPCWASMCSSTSGMALSCGNCS